MYATKLFIIVTMLMQASFANAETHIPLPPEGEFVVVALRTASDVSSNAPLDNSYHGLIGQKITFGEECVWLNAAACSAVQFVLPFVEILDIQDPNLSDVAILPEILSPSENKWDLATFSVTLDVAAPSLFLKVDNRVIIVPIANGALYAILEKPLLPQEIEEIQHDLSVLGFYDDQISGVVDRSLREAIAEAADQLGAEYRFADPVITENLLHGISKLAADI